MMVIDAVRGGSGVHREALSHGSAGLIPSARTAPAHNRTKNEATERAYSGRTVPQSVDTALTQLGRSVSYSVNREEK